MGSKEIDLDTTLMCQQATAVLCMTTASQNMQTLTIFS